jgi:hypothetical protein
MNAHIHVFVVAIEKYQNPAFPNVTYAENDANKFIECWQTLGADSINCLNILSTFATKAVVESSFKQFIQAVEKDATLVFFFAGRTISLNDQNYLLTYDTQPGNIQETSISLNTVLKEIGKRKTSRTLIFVDPNSCDLRSNSYFGGPKVTGFSVEELRNLCENTENQIVFTSCKDDESSWSNRTLEQGIWSYCLQKALSGDAKEAMGETHLLTSETLGDYLGDEIPRLLRQTRTGRETQTPLWFGNSTKPFPIADLTSIVSEKSVDLPGFGSTLKDTSLRGEKSGLVRSLSGFQKGHHVPQGHFSSAEAFVKRAGHEEVKNQADAIHNSIRTYLGYRRKNVLYTCEQDAATIKTPDFEVNLSIEQDPKDAAGYVITTEIGAIRRQQIFLEDAFSEVFSIYCDTVVIEFSGRINIEEKIDTIELIPELEAHLTYESDCSSLTLTIPKPNLIIHLTANRMSLSMPRSGNLKTLMFSVQSALSTIRSSGIQLLLPG